MRIDGGSDRSGQAVPDPKADDFACYAALFATADVCMPQFVDMVVRKYSFERRSDRMEIGGTRFCKIDIRQDFAYHGSKRGPTQNDVFAEPFFARFDLQPLIANDAYGRKFALPHSEVQECQNGRGGGAVRIFDTIAHEFCLFFAGERIALLGLIAGQYDFRHGRGNFEIVCGDVEDTA